MFRAAAMALLACLAFPAGAAAMAVAPGAVAPCPASGRPVVRTLADSWLLRYHVQIGEGGLGVVTGRATYVWRSGGGRYSLVSTLEATGFAALFVTGKIVQVSEGRIDADGMHPERYMLQRSASKKDVARLDWGRNRIILEGRGEAELTPQAQDLLSFPFFLAMTARDGEPDFRLGVTNGRKFNEYLFQVMGRATLDLSGHRVATLHLHGAKTGEGELDAWLDLGRSGLPVRVRTVDRKGQVATMQLEAVANAELASGDQL